MRLAIPSMADSLSYTIAAAIAITVFEAVVMLIFGPDRLVGFVLVLAVALAIYWLVGHNRVTIVSARDAAITAGLLLLVCAFADLLSGYPYQAVLFLLAAAACGFAFMLLHRGATSPLRRLMPPSASPPSQLAHLRMLEELRAAGILTADEFAAKRMLLGV